MYILCPYLLSINKRIRLLCIVCIVCPFPISQKHNFCLFEFVFCDVFPKHFLFSKQYLQYCPTLVLCQWPLLNSTENSFVVCKSHFRLQTVFPTFALATKLFCFTQNFQTCPFPPTFSHPPSTKTSTCNGVQTRHASPSVNPLQLFEMLLNHSSTSCRRRIPLMMLKVYIFPQLI